MRYQKNKRFFLVFLLLFAIAGLVSVQEPLADEVEVDPGQITFRSSVSEADFEKIDPYSGNLTLTHTDAVLPGHGGHDLRIIRTYDGNRRISEATAFGGRWDLHFGRLKKAGVKIILELQDDTVNTAYKERYDSAFSTSYIYLTKDFWRVDLSGTPTLYLPDGTTVVFGRGGNSAYNDWYYATQIWKDNTVINIHYGVNRWVDHVIDTIGRRVDFYYDTIQQTRRLRFISCSHESGQRDMVVYSYPANSSILNHVVYPDGDTWQYEYLNSRISRVHTPYGGLVEYAYDLFTRGWRGLTMFTQYSVSSKTISGHGVPIGTWTYDYGFKTQTSLGHEMHLDYTAISDPIGRTTMYHFFGYAGGYDDGIVNECYLYGLTQRKFTVDSQGRVEEAIDYTWGALAEPISPVGYSVTYACSDGAVYVPVVLEEAIYHGGTLDYMYLNDQDPSKWSVFEPTDIYVTRYDPNHISGYGHPGVIRQYNKHPAYIQDGLEKTITRTYWYNEARNIVDGRTATEQIAGNSAVPGTFLSTFDYYNNGEIRREDKYGVETNYTYDNDGNLASSTDANGNTTAYQWHNGAMQSISNPVYDITREINWDGTVAAETNGKGNTTHYTYTPGMRLNRVSPPLGNPTVHTYRFGANSISRQTRGGFSDTAHYDGMGRERATSNSLGITSSTVRNAAGLISSTNSSIGDQVLYDNRGRIVRINHKDGTYVTFNHISDREVRITDEERKTSINYYYPMGAPGEKHLVRHHDALGRQVSFTSNVLGSLLTIQRDGLSRSFTYDSRNFLVSESHPESGTYHYTERDDMGNLLRKTENGKVVTYSYDDLNRLKTTASGNYFQHFFYDNNDNLTGMNSPGVSIVQQYDPADRLISRTSTVNGKSGKITYAYNNNDYITRISYPSGTKVDYTYNTLNQVTRVSGFGGELKNITYYSTGEQNGLLHRYTRDNNQVVTLNWDKQRRMSS